VHHAHAAQSDHCEAHRRGHHRTVDAGLGPRTV
jgi:hypothetical protein